MVTAMNEMEKQAAFYRGFLADDRSVASVAVVLMTAVAMWLLFYLVSLIGPLPNPAFVRQIPEPASGAAPAGDPSGFAVRGPLARENLPR